jgi:hypothetical protein
MTSLDLSIGGGGGETVCVVTVRSPVGVPSDPWENTDAWKRVSGIVVRTRIDRVVRGFKGNERGPITDRGGHLCLHCRIHAQ